MAAKNSSVNNKQKSKSPHGKQHPINMGSVAKATEGSEAGRDHKRAQQKMLDQAKQRAFEQRCLAALPIGRLLETLDGPSLLGHEFVTPVSKTVKVPVRKTEENPTGFETKVISGHVIITAEPGSKEGCPVVRVIASDFGGIPASSLYLPLVFVFKRYFHSYLSAEATEMQGKIHGLLRSVLKEEIEARLSARAGSVEAAAVTVSVAQKTQAEEPAVVVAPKVTATKEPQGPAVQLRVTDLVARQRNWESERNFLYLANELGTAYFCRKVEGGAAKLVLVKTTDDHPLASLLDEHAEVSFDIAPILSKGPVPEEGDMHDVRVARRVVQNYLRQAVLKLGFKPAWVEALAT